MAVTTRQIYILIFLSRALGKRRRISWCALRPFAATVQRTKLNYETRQSSVALDHPPRHRRLVRVPKGKKPGLAHYLGGVRRRLESLRRRNHFPALFRRYSSRCAAGRICHATGENEKIHAGGLDAGSHDRGAGLAACQVLRTASKVQTPVKLQAPKSKSQPRTIQNHGART